MNELTNDEQVEIDLALLDSEGWALSQSAAQSLIETLSTKGLIAMSKGRWQLTPAGCVRRAMYRA